MNSKTLHDLPAWWWAGIPAVMLSLTLYAYFYSAELMMLLIRRDEHPDGGGIAEHGILVVLIPGIVAGITILRYYRDRLPLWMVGWMWCAVLACVYFAGEEASWGQHFFHWMTPEVITGLNDQHETNLHNMSTWLDQKPRALVETGMVFGTLLVPLIRRFRPRAFWAERGWSRWFWPTAVGIPALSAFLFTLVVGLIAKNTGRVDLHQLGSNELREFYIGLYLSTYLLSLWYRLRQTTGR